MSYPETSEPLHTNEEPRPSGTLNSATRATRRVVDVFREAVEKSERPNTYKYKNIQHHKEIRILKLYADESESPINCRLVTRRLFDHGDISSTSSDDTALRIPYSALSYYWGTDKAENKIYVVDDDEAYMKLIRGKSHIHLASYFHIQNNLYDALRQLRSEDDDVYVWADAICINQKNIKERTAQVNIMHEVYKHAEEVLIWLGRGTPEKKAAFGFLESILDLQELECLVKRLEPPKKKDRGHKDQARKDTLQDCKNVIDLMKTDWFGRRWIIQELALAKRPFVLQGDYRMPWSDFADAIALFMTKYDSIRRAFKGPESYKASRNFDDHLIRALDANALGANILVTTTGSLFRRSQEGAITRRLLSLETLVSSMLLAFEASDPKDTVFAILQIARDIHVKESTATASSLDERIAPNYQKCLRDVYIDFIGYCIDKAEEKSNSLDILCRHWAPYQSLSSSISSSNAKLEMPSWILPIEGNAFGGPNDPYKRRKHGDSFVGAERRRCYTAGGNSNPKYTFGMTNVTVEDPEKDLNITPGDYTELPLHTGKELASRFDGTLKVKGFRLGIIEDHVKINSCFLPREALELCGWSENDIEFERGLDRCWRILVADRGPDGQNPPTWYRRACKASLDWFKSQRTEIFNLNELKNFDDTPSGKVDFINRVERVVWNRNIIRVQPSGDTTRSLSGLAPAKAMVKDVICILYGCSVPVVLRPKNGSEEFEFLGESFIHEMMDGEAIEEVASEDRNEMFILR